MYEPMYSTQSLFNDVHFSFVRLVIEVQPNSAEIRPLHHRTKRTFGPLTQAGDWALPIPLTVRKKKLACAAFVTSTSGLRSRRIFSDSDIYSDRDLKRSTPILTPTLLRLLPSKWYQALKEQNHRSNSPPPLSLLAGRYPKGCGSDAVPIREMPAAVPTDHVLIMLI